MSSRADRIRDEFILYIPYLIAVIATVVIAPYLPRKNIFVWLTIGGAIGLASFSTWLLPPFKAIQLRKLKAALERRKSKS